MQNKLDVKIIKTLQPTSKPQNYFDGGGLALQISPQGNKTWVFFYRFAGKQYRTTLGGYPVLSLEEARLWHIQSKQLLSHNICPQHVKDSFNLNQYREEDYFLITTYLEKWYPSKLANITQGLKLSSVIDEWLQNFLPYVRKDTYEMERLIKKDIYTILGDKDITKIKLEDVNKLTDSIKKRGSSYMARRNFDFLKRIFNYAINRGYLATNILNTVKGEFIASYKNRTRALSAKEVGILFKEIYKSSLRRQYKLGLHLILITMVRKSELRLAKWIEVDLDNDVWIIPSERMKLRREHVVYLSKQAIKMFKELKYLSDGSNLVLPTKDDLTKPIARLTLNGALNQINPMIDHFVIHDFRRTASTILHESGFSSDHIEKCLAHEQRGVRAIYNKAEYAQSRKEILQWWADFVDNQIGSYI